MFREDVRASVVVQGCLGVYQERGGGSQYGTVLLTHVLYWRMQCTSQRPTVTLSFENPPFHDCRRLHSSAGLEIRSGRLSVVLFPLGKVANPYVW